MYRIKIDRSQCIGCLTCVTACVVSHQEQSDDARNRVTIEAAPSPPPSSAATVSGRNACTPA